MTKQLQVDSERTAAEISAVLAAWPTDLEFDATSALDKNPHLRSNQRAIITFAMEEFASHIDSQEVPDARAFANRFPTVKDDLYPKLLRLLSFEAKSGLLRPDVEVRWPRVGEQVCNFKLVEQLGIGAFSRVFRAYDLMMGNRSVVVKLTRRPASECRLAGPLDHPHLAKLFSVDFDQESGLTVVCMPFLGRLTCDDLREVNPFIGARRPLGESEPFEPAAFMNQALRIMVRVAEGVDYLHKRGIVHRDIKPSNIVLDAELQPTVVDFNASSSFTDSDDIVVGTLPYVAPEILEGIKAGGLTPGVVGPTTDVYSVGLVCYELLSGSLPFDVPQVGEDPATAVQDLRQCQLTSWVPIKSRNPYVSRQLAGVISQAIDQSVQSRFKSLREFTRVLKREIGLLGRVRTSLRCSRRARVGTIAAGIAATALIGTSAASVGHFSLVAPTDLVSLSEATRESEMRAYITLKPAGPWRTKSEMKVAAAEAEALLKLASTKGQLSTASINNLAFAMLILERTDEAEPLLARAQAIAPKHPTVLQNIISCELLKCSNAGHEVDARACFEYLNLPADKVDAKVVGLAAMVIDLAMEQATDESARSRLTAAATRARALQGSATGTRVLAAVINPRVPLQ